MDFKTAYQTYIHLKQQHERGQITSAEFETRVNELPVTDSAGALWQIGVKTGKWYRFDGQEWQEEIPAELISDGRPQSPVPAQPVVRPAPVNPLPQVSAQPVETPKSVNWVTGCVVAGVVGLCCLIIVAGGWLVWNYYPSPESPIVMTIPVSAIPSVRPSIPSVAPVIPSETAVVRPTASPEPVAGPGFDPNLVHFEDDFSNPGSGWDDIRVRDDFNTYYFEDAYLFVLIKAAVFAEANPHKNFPGDMQVEVDARKTSGSKFDEYGLLCRYAENSDGTHSSYYFAISSDGLGVIYKIDHNKKSLILTNPPKNRSDVIHPGDQVNHIRGDCVGNKLTLYVNNQALVSAVDSSFNSGGVGLRGDSEAGETEIRFDNFIVFKPGN